MLKRPSPFIALPLLLVLAACQNAGVTKTPRAGSMDAPRPSVTAHPVAAESAPIGPPVASGSSAPSPPSPAASAAAPEPPWPPEPPAGVVTDFCIDVVNALDEETCYVLPERPTKELLLYFHGIVPPLKKSLQKTNVQTVVANASRRAGIAALMPRGRRGLAPKAQSDWYGWPTTAGAYRQLAAELVRSFTEKREKLEALTGTRFERLYVAGSSSGAYFTAALALNGGIDAHAFAAISGGSFPPLEQLEALPPRPVYIGYGSYDTVGPELRVLASRLEKASWPVKVSVHAFPHGSREIYLDEAFAFFREELRLATPEPAR